MNNNQNNKGENASTKHVNEGNAQNNMMDQAPRNARARIYNLIIVDESGSMSSLRQATRSGVNEIIQTIRQAQKDHGDKQDHFLTLVTFDSGHGREDVRTLIDAAPIAQVEDFTNYNPYGGTPLYDAIGISLTCLHERIKNDEDATAVVTILTDGMENSSRTWTQEAVSRLISDLKEEGWSFSYMGSCHDVHTVSVTLSIDHAVEFTHDEIGTQNTWEREKSSRRAYFEKMSREYDPGAAYNEKREMKKRNAREYYANRVTPFRIDQLGENEVFVFGSNPRGQHLGGAARSAVLRFGAQMGVGEGMQGRSYAIPTTDGMQLFGEAVYRFIQYAESHPEMKFLVTRVGCGISGYSPREVAPLFRNAVQLENVLLPEDFWMELGLRML